MSVNTCTVCNKEYETKQTKKVYGELPVLSNCCSSQCYTKKVFSNSIKK